MSGYPYAENIFVKFCPTNPFGTAPFSQANQFSTTLTNNCKAPLPPGNVKLNNYGYENWPASIGGDATLSWTIRNRVLHGPGTPIIAQDNATAESIEGTLTIQVLINGSVARTFVNITNSSLTYTRAQRLSDNSNMSLPVQFRITPVGPNYSGTVRTTPSFVMT